MSAVFDVLPAAAYQRPDDPMRVLAEAAEPGLAAAVRAVLRRIAADIDVQRLTRLIAELTPRHGGVVFLKAGMFGAFAGAAAQLAAAVVDLIGLGVEAIMSRLRPIMNRLQGLHDEAATAANPGYSRVAPRAVDALRAEEERIATQISDAAARTVEEVVAEGLSERWTADVMAQRIREVISLNERQAQAVANFRRALETGDRTALQRALRDRRFDSTIRRAIDSGQKLEPEQIDRMVRRYTERMLDHRAQTIAAYEATRAANAGAREAARQMAAATGQTVRRFWQVCQDERLCPTCRATAVMNAGGVGIDQPYQTPAGDSDGPPLHTNCRCTEVTTYGSGSWQH